MKPQIQAILFDADGTLIDSEVPGMDVLHEMAQAHGLTISRHDAHEQFRGLAMRQVASWVAAQLGQNAPEFSDTFIKQARQTQAERFRQKGIDAMPGAHELVRRLAIPYCVATNGPREKVELTLELSGLRPWFAQHVYTAYEVNSFKPAPGLFLHAAQALGVSPEHCAVVEDSLPGMQAGVAAGMQVFALLPREFTPPELQQRVTFITHLLELEQYLHPEALLAA